MNVEAQHFLEPVTARGGDRPGVLVISIMDDVARPDGRAGGAARFGGANSLPVAVDVRTSISVVMATMCTELPQSSSLQRASGGQKTGLDSAASRPLHMAPSGRSFIGHQTSSRCGCRKSYAPRKISCPVLTRDEQRPSITAGTLQSGARCADVGGGRSYTARQRRRPARGSSGRAGRVLPLRPLRAGIRGGSLEGTGRPGRLVRKRQLLPARVPVNSTALAVNSSLLLAPQWLPGAICCSNGE